MKIAVYSGTIPSTTFIELLIKGLADRGHTVYLFGNLDEPIKYYSPNIHMVGTSRNRFKLILQLIWWYFRLLILRPRILHAFHEHLKTMVPFPFASRWRFYGRVLPILNYPVDIFHFQWARAVPDMYFLRDIMKFKVVVSLRGGQINYGPIVNPELADKYRSIFPKIDAFHAVSQAIKEESIKYGAIPERIKVIKSLIQITKRTPNDDKQLNPTLNIITVGRFHWKKGYPYALDACKILKDNGIKFNYHLIARGENEEIIYQINDLHLTSEVKITAGLSHDKVMEAIAAADIMLLPSVEEGIANVVLEAMALGTPVIVTNCGGMDEVIRDGENGFIVPVRNPMALASKVTYFLSLTDKQRIALVNNAKNDVVKDFEFDQQLDKMISLYRGLLPN